MRFIFPKNEFIKKKVEIKTKMPGPSSNDLSAIPTQANNGKCDGKPRCFTDGPVKPPEITDPVLGKETTGE